LLESRSQSPLRQLIKYASQEIKELRTLHREKYSKTPEINSKDSIEKNSRSIDNSPSFKPRVSSSFKPIGKIYYMNPNYQPDQNIVSQKSSISFSRLTSSVEQSILAKAKKEENSNTNNENVSEQTDEVKKIIKHQLSDPFNKIVMVNKLLLLRINKIVSG